ncbi:MAG: hypothetical protein JWR15_956 [Prosthecobacter sp.]|nr:hypothetical protein [Prosthecobacter sp.]
MPTELENFLETHTRSRGRAVPARLQAGLVLLERLRDYPALELSEHRAPGSSGVKSHETFGNRVHERLGLEPINKNHGRRSSNLPEWGQYLLDAIASVGFAKASTERREVIINQAQTLLAKPLRAIIEQEPLEARIKGRSVETIIHDLLLAADEKGKSGEVAQYLVGAKLVLRFKREIPVHPANKSDRKYRADENAKLGDFDIQNAVIEVAVGPADQKHLQQMAEILDKSDKEVWLLTRADRVNGWKNEVDDADDIDSKRVVVTSVEAFVGQNITELAEFSTAGKVTQLRLLFDIYNSQWVEKVGTPGIRIALK